MNITNLKIKIPKKEVLNRLGYKAGVTKESNLHLVDEQLQEAYSLIDPKAVYKDFDIVVKNGSISLKGSFTIKSKTLAKRLKDCKKATLVALTIGPGLEKKTKDLVTNVIRDAIGSEAVEELANEVNKIITQHAKLKGYKTIARYSVGYGDWDIKDQPKILKALNVRFIKTGKSYMMKPRKSITAIIGLIKNNSFR
ncbi:hypothetical protein KY360_06840 [Candidatus Woesearchaeota archaeon]|nr:hypothetical protein [Candidatus Woesearchaeota archaeon]